MWSGGVTFSGWGVVDIDSEHMKVMECATIVLDTEGKKGPRTEAGDDISDACE